MEQCNSNPSNTEELPYIVAVDFDGTLVKGCFPQIGELQEWVVRQLKHRIEIGQKAILWTCRTGKALDEAIQFCKNNGLIFDAINENLQIVIDTFGGDPRKIYANEYWDDRANYLFSESHQKARSQAYGEY